MGTCFFVRYYEFTIKVIDTHRHPSGCLLYYEKCDEYGIIDSDNNYKGAMFMTFDRNKPTGLQTTPDISFLDDILAEDTAIAVSDKFDPNLFQNGVHVDANGNVTHLAENWEEILADLNASHVQL